MNEAHVRDILRILCRKTIPRAQLVLYRVALERPDKAFRSADIRQALDFQPAEYRGMMAALSVRINNTERETEGDDRPGIGFLFRREWAGNEYEYQPLPELLAAIKRLPQLAEFLARPLVEVVASEKMRFDLPEGIEELAPRAPAIPSTPPTVPQERSGHFAGLLGAFDSAGLVYPSELVANLVLALQVKRMVLLTGISGTGKTRIAQTLAAHFRPKRRREVTRTSGDGLLLRVVPYMLRYHRLVLPRALRAQLPGLATAHGPGTLRVRWPGGTMEAAVYTGDAVTVLFREELRAWFATEFEVGDPLRATLEARDGAPDTLVLERPKATATELEDVTNLALIAVRPDWTDHRGLLGAYNLLTRQYLPTPALSLILAASGEERLAASEGRAPAPFFLVLDEMNLARVEHYFADLLSTLESGEPLHLHDSLELEEGESEDATPIPRRLAVPSNLFFLGTVNVDESTYLFSPKVLDRAFTIELNGVDLDGLARGATRGSELDLVSWNGRLDPPARPSREDWLWLAAQEDGALHAEVLGVQRLLAQHGRHFGYRIATELARFVRLACEQTQAPLESAWDALDLALLQKVLVKLNGTRHELAPVLDALQIQTLVGVSGAPERGEPGHWRYSREEAKVLPASDSADMAALFPRSAAKVWRMRERLGQTGFTSWIE